MCIEKSAFFAFTSATFLCFTTLLNRVHITRERERERVQLCFIIIIFPILYFFTFKFFHTVCIRWYHRASFSSLLYKYLSFSLSYSLWTAENVYIQNVFPVSYCDRNAPHHTLCLYIVVPRCLWIQDHCVALCVCEVQLLRKLNAKDKHGGKKYTHTHTHTHFAEESDSKWQQRMANCLPKMVFWKIPAGRATKMAVILCGCPPLWYEK